MRPYTRDGLRSGLGPATRRRRGRTPPPPKHLPGAGLSADPGPPREPEACPPVGGIGPSAPRAGRILQPLASCRAAHRRRRGGADGNLPVACGGDCGPCRDLAPERPVRHEGGGTRRAAGGQGASPKGPTPPHEPRPRDQHRVGGLDREGEAPRPERQAGEFRRYGAKLCTPRAGF